MLRLFTLLCLSCLVVFISCQREVDFVHLGNESGDSIYINRTEVYESIPGASLQLDHTVTFYYDDQMRLTREVDSFFDFTIYVETEERIYLGNDSLPYMVVDYTNQGPERDTTFLFYNVNKKIVKDSCIFMAVGGRYTQLRTFSQTSPAAGYVSLFTYDETGILFDEYIVRCRRTITGNNLIENFDTTYTGPNPVQITNESNLYDNKINPFKRIALPYLFYKEAEWSGYLSDSHNNKTSSDLEAWDGFGTSSSRIEYSYTYNSLQLPVVMEETDPVNGLLFRTFYYYRSN